MFKFYQLMVLFALALSGCAGQKTTNSGFLAHYEQLQVSKDGNDNFVYQSPDISKYHAFMVDDPVFIPGEKSDKEIDADDLKEIKSAFKDAVIESFSERFSHANTADSDVMRIKLAITGVEKPIYWLNYLAMALAGPVSNGGASSESEIVDSVTGKRLAALCTHTNADPFHGGILGYFTSYRHARNILADHAKELYELSEK
jgi:Protein of unknown function (DUF3313)